MKHTLKTLLTCTLVCALLVSCNTKSGGDETKGTSSNTSATTQDAGTSATVSNPTTPDPTQVKTPEEIFSEIQASQSNLKIEMSAKMFADVSGDFSVVYRIDGEKKHMETHFKLIGTDISEESYLDKEGSKYTYYFIGEDEEWYWYSFDEDDSEHEDVLSGFDLGLEEMGVFFRSENFEAFDSATNRYPVKDGVVIEEKKLSDGYLEITENGYSIAFTDVDEEMGNTSVKYFFSDFGKVSISLPDATEAPTGGMETGSVGCPETSLTPGEILQKIDTTNNISVDGYVDLGDAGSVSWFMAQEGDRYWIMTATIDSEQIVTEEIYLEKLFDVVYVYQADDNGNWTKEEADPEFLAGIGQSSFDLADLLKTDNFEEYDPKTGEYVLKNGEPITIDGLGIVTSACITVYKDGSYTIHVIVSDEEGTPVSEYLFSLYDFGTTIVELPGENAMG